MVSEWYFSSLFFLTTVPHLYTKLKVSVGWPHTVEYSSGLPSVPHHNAQSQGPWVWLSVGASVCVWWLLCCLVHMAAYRPPRTSSSSCLHRRRRRDNIVTKKVSQPTLTFWWRKKDLFLGLQILAAVRFSKTEFYILSKAAIQLIKLVVDV